MPTRAPSLRSMDSTDASIPDCPRHGSGSPYTRNTDGRYADYAPACTGGPCLLGRCDIIRQALQDDSMSPLQFQRRRLVERLDAVPADTTVPAEALRIRALLDATVALYVAYQTWRDSGEDTPHTREPLELALRAAEACHDRYTPTTAIYDRICRHIRRTRVVGSPLPASPSSWTTEPQSPLSDSEMTG